MPGLWGRNPQLSHISLQPEGGGENLHPVYIITSSCPNLDSTSIPASRPWFRGHSKKSLQGDYIGQGLRVLPSCEIRTGILFFSSWKVPSKWVPNVCLGFMDPKTLPCRCKPPSISPPWHPLMHSPWWTPGTPWCVTPDDCVTCPNWSLISTTGDSTAVDYTCPTHKHTLPLCIIFSFTFFWLFNFFFFNHNSMCQGCL